MESFILKIVPLASTVKTRCS